MLSWRLFSRIQYYQLRLIMKKQYSLQNIQMLRAFAAILVIMHHTLPHYKAMGGNLTWVTHISTWGFVGVDIFFIISGFIMAYTTFSKERTILNAVTFFKHRFFRIFLGYWPFFLAMITIIFISNPNKLSTLDILGSFFLINANMFQLVLPVSWSLSYELYFYFLFLFTFLFSIKHLYILIPSFILGILFLVLYSYFTPTLPQSFFYSPFLLEFFAGVLLYMYKKYLMKIWILPLSVLLMLFSYWYGITHETKNGIYRVVTFGTGAFLMVLIALIMETKNLYQSHKYFTILGDASYTLYLSHLIILELFWMLGLRGLFQSSTPVLPLLGLALILLLCILFSILYYQKIEKPLYKKAIHHTLIFK